MILEDMLRSEKDAIAIAWQAATISQHRPALVLALLKATPEQRESAMRVFGAIAQSDAKGLLE